MQESANDVQEIHESRTEARRTRSHPTIAFLCMAALLLGKVLVARWLILGPDAALSAVLPELILIVAMLGLVDLLFRRRRFTAYIVLDAVFSLYLFALTEYVLFYERMLAPGAFRLAVQVSSIGPSIIALLEPAFLLFVVDIPVLILLHRKVSALVGDRKRLAPMLSVAIVVALLVTPILAIWAGAAPSDMDDIATAKARGVLPFETAALGEYAFTSGLLGLMGVGQPLTKDPVAKDVDYSSPSSVQAAIEAASRRASGERIATFERGQYAGANVIVIQVESLQRLAIDSWITPSLDAMTGESWYFPNGFSDSGLGTTADAEFAMNSSLYPPSDDPASVAYVDRVIPSLPRLLAEKGYYTFTMHANTARYWNRKELYPALGFADYYDRAFFGTDHKIGMGASDRQLFKKALPVIVEEAARGPIYCQLVTITPHHPFRMPAGTIGIELPDWLKGSTVGNYLEAMNYEDRQIGWFVDQLKANGLWDTSVVVVYGDHAGLRTTDLDQNDNLQRVETLIGHKYSAIVHLPKQRSGVLCTTAVGQVDLMPTIADALGLDLSQTPHFGRDAFEASRPLLVGRSGLPQGSFINDRIVCAARDDFDSSQAISLKTREEAELIPSDRADWSNVRTLQAISDTYVETLPARAESQGTEGAIIPRKLKAK
jgi:lipoteichoic acid synthase